MTGNRVEQLESRVRELEATLNGLTDELVDTKDRLETVEGAVAAEETPTRRADIVEGELLGDGDRDADAEASEDDGPTAGDGESDTDTDTETEAEVDETVEDIEDAEETDGIIVA